jgi:predicted RNase H-like HicB family nuclease
MTETVVQRLRDAEQELADIEARHGHYSLHLVWDPDDRIYVVTVPELPGCRTHGATAVEAATKARDAIVTWLAAALHWGDAIPLPATERHVVEEQYPNRIGGASPAGR